MNTLKHTKNVVRSLLSYVIAIVIIIIIIIIIIIKNIKYQSFVASSSFPFNSVQ